MKQILANLYSEYGRYIDSQRAIPSENDCLKPVERRLLVSVHEVAPSGGKLHKSAKVVGYCIGNYHCHGDASSYEALVGLVNRGLVSGQGNWGRRGLDDSPFAHMRYTECKEQKIVNDIISELLPYTPRESIELDPEPLYLPSPIPMGLIGEGVITGIGFNITRICRYSYGDLLKRLYELLTNAETKTIIKPAFKDCVVKEETLGEFEKILTTGEGTIEVVPVIKTLNANTLIIHGIHPLVGFTKFKNFNSKFEEVNEVPYFDAVDMWNYKSKTSLEIHVTPYKKKQLNEEFVKKIIDLISGRINIKVNVVDETTNTVKQVGIDHLLLQSYNKWKNTHKIQIEHIIKKLKQEIYEIDIIELIRIIVSKNTTNDVELIAKEVVKLNNNFTEKEVITVCDKYRIRKLIQGKFDKTELQNNVNKYQNNLNTLNITIFNLFKTKFLKM